MIGVGMDVEKYVKDNKERNTKILNKGGGAVQVIIKLA